MAEAEANTPYEIVYFDVAGRAEVMKLCCLVGGIDFTETSIGKNWKEIKPTTPWGSLPYVKKGGKMMGQSRALSRYFAKKANLYPTNAKQAAQVDAIYDFCEDISGFVISQGKAEEVRKGHWAEGGGMIVRLTALDKYIGDLPGDTYAVGNSLSMADLTIFAWMNSMVSGFWDHFPGPEGLVNFKNIQRIRALVSQIPAIANRYKVDKKDQARWAGLVNAVFSVGDNPGEYGAPTIGEWDEDKSTPKAITYFNAAGRAELARAMLTMAGKEFENKTMGMPEWKTMKQKMVVPLGNQMPFLTTSDDVCLTQSIAFSRYVAKQCGMYPENDEVAQISDAIVEACVDIGGMKYKLGKDDKAIEEAFNNGKLGMLTKKLNVVIASTEGKFACGTEMSWADVSVWATMANMGGFGNEWIKKNCPAIMAAGAEVAKNEALVARYKSEEMKNNPAYKDFIANSGCL